MFNYAPERKKIWENGGVAPRIFISVLDNGDWSASRYGRFTQGKAFTVTIE
jgi:hypothetical protein